MEPVKVTVGLAEQGGEASSSEVANVKGEKAVKAEGSRTMSREVTGLRFRFLMALGTAAVCVEVVLLQEK